MQSYEKSGRVARGGGAKGFEGFEAAKVFRVFKVSKVIRVAKVFRDFFGGWGELLLFIRLIVG
ncbi:MAG: hypothetical protein K2G06_00840, partial [Muribaculaceae bacterium]|nr:hypothetical protein [Muribaculaceae bacterium]